MTISGLAPLLNFDPDRSGRCAACAPTSALVRISANVTDDFGNVTGLGPVLGCADLIVGMGSV